MSDKPYLRIATEEAFAPPEMIRIYEKILAGSDVDPGFKGLMGFYMSSPSERAQHIMRCLQDLDQIRIAHMDEAGIDHQVLALTAPGVQIMDKATAVSFARVANDQLADAVRRHPTRFTGMIAVPVQDPQEAWWIALNNIDPERDTRFTMGPVDVLDHASRAFTYGSKMGIDATRKFPEEGFTRNWPEIIEMDAGTKQRVDALWPSLGLDPR